MLWMDIVRSPFAHAKIKSINIEKAMKVPGVLAVITVRRWPSTTSTGCRP
jgi:carbon-monoxide dehydrogenase large subunit